MSCGTCQLANAAIGALGDCKEIVFPNVHTLLTILATLPVIRDAGATVGQGAEGWRRALVLIMTSY